MFMFTFLVNLAHYVTPCSLQIYFVNRPSCLQNRLTAQLQTAFVSKNHMVINVFVTPCAFHIPTHTKVPQSIFYLLLK